MSSEATPDQIISDLGGCGRYQWLISSVAHAMKSLVCWGVMTMMVVSVTPPWSCDDVDPANGTTYLPHDVMYDDTAHSDAIQHNETSFVITHTNSTPQGAYFKACETPSGRACGRYKFDGRATLVSEFDLVCEATYVPSLIMSIQSVGSLAGNLLAGQISDLFGRKRPYFASVLITTVFSLVGYLCNSWVLFAVTRFMVGMGGSSFITTMYSLLSEFTLARYRAWLIGFPSWPIETCIFVLVAWLVNGWRNIQLATAILGIPCLMMWWIMPESFRWHLSHDRPDAAEQILQKVARMNGKPLVTSQQLAEIRLVDKVEQKDRKYTVLDIFRSRYLIKLSFLMSFTWLAIGFVAYGIKFGIQSLSGSVYMNMFLFSISEIPPKFVFIWLENRIGRRRSAILCFLIMAIGGFAAGIVHYIDTPNRNSFVNWFAFMANIGVQTAWGPIQTMTIELYPTVIRSIGFGTLATLARIGAIIAPQFVFLSTRVPGIMFLMCGVLSTFSMLALMGLTETRGANLNDKITQHNVDDKTTQHDVDA